VKKRISSLSARMVMAFLALHLVMAALLFRGVLYLVEENYQSLFVDQVRNDASHLASLGSETGIALNYLASEVEEEYQDGRIVFAQITDTRGDTLASVGDAGGSYREDFAFGEGGDTIYHIRVPLFDPQGARRGELRLDYDEAETLAHIHQAYRSGLYLTLAIVVLILTATVLLGRQLTRPIEKLRAASVKIARGHYDEALQVKTGVQEIAELADALEHMREVLVTQRNRIHYQALHDALTDLATDGTINNPDPQAFRELLLRTAADALNVDRVSIWLLDDARQTLRCSTSFERCSAAWSSGHELKHSDYPHYFSALESGELIIAADAHHDVATRDFSKDYLTPLGIGAMLDAPIRRAGRVVGVVCHEHLGGKRHWHVEEQGFAGRIADLVALHMESQRSREAREEAENANRAKSQFLSSMSHELRTPMNAILGFAQLLELEALSTEQSDSVREIRRAGQHLLELINEVLDLARIESGHLDLHIEPVPVSNVLNDCQTMIAPLLEKYRVSLQSACETCRGVTVLADPMRLKQALLNLLSNACKYNRPGGTVTITCEAGVEDRVRIRVQDSGPGITAEDLPRLFRPFTRLVAECSDVEGTGIGLVITRELIEGMDGDIGVDSTPGEGSTFWVELRVADDAKTLEHR